MHFTELSSTAWWYWICKITNSKVKNSDFSCSFLIKIPEIHGTAATGRTLRLKLSADQLTKITTDELIWSEDKKYNLQTTSI